jgi:hypothetical protein
MLSSKKKTIVRVLFSTVLILLIIFIVLEKLYQADGSSAKIPGGEIDSVFVNTLNDFGIEKSWYTKKGDSYNVKLPPDLPSEIIVMDLTEKLQERGLRITSREIVKRGKSVLQISSENINILTAEFDYKKELFRKLSSVSFIIVNTENLTETERFNLLNLQENYSVAIEPSKNNRRYAAYLKEKGKDYAVLINNNTNQLEYDLDDKFSDRKLIFTSRTIIDHFANATMFLIDKNSNRLSERSISIFQEEMKTRRMRHFPLQKFTYFDNLKDPEQLNLLMENNQVYIIEAAEYIKIMDQIRLLKKKGLKIVNVTELAV